ncbi:MAG: hypothetical protein PHS45_03430 [Bacilli bacterium]|nr:hypothetical protein [Bacilli bacterium]
MYKVAEISWPQTKKNVIEVLKTFDYYSLSLTSSRAMEIDNSFNLKINFVNNDICVLENKKHKERIDFIEKVVNAYNKLSNVERKIIYRTYLANKKVNDDLIANDLGFSVKYYYKIKKETIIKLAFALGIEVLKKDDNC